MKCNQSHGPAVATIQVIHPQVNPQKDEVCAACLGWWDSWSWQNPEVEVRIELLGDAEAALTEASDRQVYEAAIDPRAR